MMMLFLFLAAATCLLAAIRKSASTAGNDTRPKRQDQKNRDSFSKYIPHSSTLARYTAVKKQNSQA
jgi:hypothetical protein